MTNVAELADAMRGLLGPTADRLAREAGFVKRGRELTGSTFSRALVFGWLSEPGSSLSGLASAAATAGADVTPQAVHKRFTPTAARFLRALLSEAVARVLEADPVAIPLLGRFSGVYIQDGSVVGLPAELAELWGGCGGRSGPTAALKLAVRLDLLRGGLSLYLEPGRSHDKATPVQHLPIPEGALRLADLGYFDLAALGEIHAAEAYFVTRVQAGVVVYEGASGRRTSISELLGAAGGDLVDIPILLGAGHRLPARLIAERVPERVAQERGERLEADAKRRGQPASATRLGWVGWTIYATKLRTRRPSSWMRGRRSRSRGRGGR